MNIFSSWNTFWNWLSTSSQNPDQTALTVEGYTSSIVPVLMYFIHTPSLSNLPNEVYAVIVAALGLVSGVTTVYGLVRKIFYPTAAFTAQFAPKQPGQ